MLKHIFDEGPETIMMEKNSDSIISKDDLFSNENVFIEKPLLQDSDIIPLNGKHAPDDEDEDEGDEDDLILGDEDEAEGDEEEYDVELEEDVPDDISENDLVIDPDDDIDEDDEDDDL